MIRFVDGPDVNRDLAVRLRRVVDEPLEGWREIYEGFSPKDLETGERHPRVPEPGEDCRWAAVLVPILLSPERAQVVYTLRKGDLHDHAGQVSFPGGVPEPHDASLFETALREAEEEIALRPENVEVIGELEELYVPPSKFLVRPFVGLLPREVKMTLDSGEVEEVVWEWDDGRLYEVPIFSVSGYEIWGATAAMTGVLLARLGWSVEGIAETEE